MQETRECVAGPMVFFVASLFIVTARPYCNAATWILLTRPPSRNATCLTLPLTPDISIDI